MAERTDIKNTEFSRKILTLILVVQHDKKRVSAAFEVRGRPGSKHWLVKRLCRSY